MKKLFIFLLAILTGTAFAYMNIEQEANGFAINYSNENHENAEESITKIIALPSQSASILLINVK